MNRAPLAQLAMDGGNINDHQSMTQLLQSCTALHAVANTSPTQQNGQNIMANNLNLQKLHSDNNNDLTINDENLGPNLTPKLNTATSLQKGGSSKMDLADLAQITQMRKNRQPTMSRRNERERNRVRYLNFTFDILRQHLPGKSTKGKAKKMSKVDTLRRAIDYIYDLQELLDTENCEGSSHRVSQGSASAAGSPSEGDLGTSHLTGSGAVMSVGESENDSLSPNGSPHYSGDSHEGGENDQLGDNEDSLSNFAGWFC